MIESSDSILTVREVADYLRVNQRTVYRLAVVHKLPGFKVGATWRFKRADIDEWIRQQAVEGLDTGQGVRDQKKSGMINKGKE
ncbi:MAG: helix-turn-helix domain-containing protein [Pseudomonadota bacterium]